MVVVAVVATVAVVIIDTTNELWMFVRLFTILNIKNETIINWFQILNQFEHEKLFTTVFIENWEGEGREIVFEREILTNLNDAMLEK